MKKILGCLAVAAVAAGVMVVRQSTSAMATPTIHVAKTNGEGVLIFPAENNSRPALGWMAEGTTPTFHCFTHGKSINGLDVWFKVTHRGITGFYPSYYDDSSYSSDADLTARYGVPRCDAPPAPAPPAAASPAAPAQMPGYDRGAAVAWALKHAKDPQPFDAACTWFVSQALWAGGLAATDEWTSKGGHGILQKRPGTPAATAVPLLLDYLRRTYQWSQWGDITSQLKTNAVPAAQPGDIMAYDWEGDGALDHLAFVVNIAPGQYPEVGEWGTVDASQWGSHPRSTYQKRGWTYSEVAPKGWLQTKHPGMQVLLLHMDPDPGKVPTY